MSLVKDKTVLISGGTGSLGKVLTRRLLNDQSNLPPEDHYFFPGRS